MLSNIINKIKENKNIFTGNPEDNSFINSLSDRLKKLNISPLSDELIQFYQSINGMMYNGIEIFSYSLEKVIEPESSYTLIDLYEFNRSITYSKKWQSINGLLIFGKSDEEFYAVNSSRNKYSLLAREDYAVYKIFNSLAEFLYYILEERGGIEKNSNIFFEGRLKKILLDEIINEINVVQKIPVSIIDLELDKDLSGSIIGRETHHIIKTILKVDIIDHIVLWSFNDSEPYKFSLKKYLSDEEINKINSTDTNQGLQNE